MMNGEGDVADPSNYETVRAVLKGAGKRAQVYVDAADVDRVDRAVVQDLIVSFDDRTFPRIAARFGTARDVDGDGRFTVLLSSRLGRMDDGRSAVDGYVKAADLEADVPAPFGNHCDMMYLHTAVGPGPYLRTIVAHEYLHAVAYSQKCLGRTAPDGGRPDEEGWLDEAIAHLVEDELGYSVKNLDYRVSAFLSRPESYRLVVEDYFAEGLFRDHGTRGSAYLFLRWCVDQYGPGLLPALVRSPLRGVANLESATGSTFEGLYRRWSLDLFRSGMTAVAEGTAPSETVWSASGLVRENERENGNGGTRGLGFTSVHLRSPFGRWDLAGPRCARIAAGGPSEHWTAPGTSTRFVLVSAPSAGAVEVEVTGPPEARLQVTALPLAGERARLGLSVRVERGPKGAPVLRARADERNGVPVRLSSLSCEPLEPAPQPRPDDAPLVRLDMLGVAHTFGTSAVPPGGTILSGPIPLAAPLQKSDGPWVVKAVGTDAHGHRISAWADIPSNAAAEPEPGAAPAPAPATQAANAPRSNVRTTALGNRR